MKIALPSRYSTLLVTVLAFFLMTGCAGVLNPGPAPKRLQLLPQMPTTQTKAYTGKPKQLVVAMPLAGNDIDTDFIALVFHEREVRYLSGSKWTTPVPRLLQSSFIAALESTRALRGVADESAGIAADAKLLCDVRQFSLHYQDEQATPVAVIQATFKLANLANGTIMGTLPIKIAVPAQEKSNDAAVQAMEDALTQVLNEVTPWALATMQSAGW